MHALRLLPMTTWSTKTEEWRMRMSGRPAIATGIILLIALLGLIAFQFGSRGTHGETSADSQDGRPDVSWRSGRQRGGEKEVGLETYETKAKAARSREEREHLLREILEGPMHARYPGEGLKELFEGWFGAAPAEALAAIEGIENPGFRFIALCSGIPAFIHAPEQLDRQAASLLGPTEVDRFRHLMFTEIGRSDPAAGQRLLDTMEGAKREELFKTMSRTWIADDPRAACLALAHFGLPDQDTLLQRSTVLGAGAFRIDDLIWAKEQGLPDRFVSAMAFRAVGSSIRDHGVGGMLDELGKLDDHADFASAILRVGSSVDPEGLVAEFDRLEKMGLLDKPTNVEVTISRLYSEDPASAFAFFKRAENSAPQAAVAAKALSTELVRENIDKCGQWVLSLDAGPIRDAAIQPILTYLEKHGENEALRRWESMLSVPNEGNR
jgi:hypothetical protein